MVDGVRHDLAHLHPFRFELTIAAKGDKPERRHRFLVSFSIHAFTRAPKAGEGLDPARSYSDPRETRLFDPERYHLSFMLPGIIRDLGSRKVFHTGHGTYFTVEVFDRDGKPEEYSVYFEVGRSERRGELRLYVRSAYVQEQIPRGRPRPRKPIRLAVIAHNVSSGKAIKAPE